MPIKEIEARSAVPRDKAYKLADSGGLFLLVQPNGSKLRRMKHRFNGNEKLLSSGAYPETSLSAARQQRLNAKQTIAQGQDPMAGAARPNVQNAKLFERIAILWRENRDESMSPAHALRVWFRLERDVLPVLGALHIERIAAFSSLAGARADRQPGCRSSD